MKQLITLLCLVMFSVGSLMANPDGRDILTSEKSAAQPATTQERAQTESTLALEPIEATETEATANATEATEGNAAAASIFQDMSAKDQRKMERKVKRTNKLINKAAKSNKKAGFFTRVAAKLKFAALKKLMGDNQVVAILLAFFFGGLGVHRVYMGGRGILILLYFVTCGGIFGILPFIDFIMLIIDPDRYVNNDKFIAL